MVPFVLLLSLQGFAFRGLPVTQTFRGLPVSQTFRGLPVTRPSPAVCGRGARSAVRASAAADPPPHDARAATLAMLERCLRVANLEDAIAAAEDSADLEGAIASYEELLSLQPVDDGSLDAETSARRGLQELLLESARRELVSRCAEEADAEGCPTFLEQAQAAGEAYRRFALRRALDDVGRIRRSLAALFDQASQAAESDARRALSEAALPDAVLAGWQLEEAARRASDTRLLRKSIENDLNHLELALLAGDPSLAFLRSELSRALKRPMPPVPRSLWLEEQCETGALPRDPELLRCLLEHARSDPQLVERLVTQAKDTRGEDIYTRRENDYDQNTFQ